MNWIWLLAAIVQCVIFLGLWRIGKTRFAPQHIIPIDRSQNIPTVGMIIPAAGTHPNMQAALRSLLQQDYPHLLPIIVTATQDEPAAKLTCQLQQEFPHLQHVVAGIADGCGQKNHNTLQAIAALNNAADIYVFCDSTHTAQRNFVHALIQPILEGKSNFSTGYHMVVAKDDSIITRSYQLCVLLMRLLQAVAVFTQPWGGAMAIRREAFQKLNIAQFWAHNVVDDCSLAGLLLRHKERVILSPDALLITVAEQHKMGVWQAWMDRQILFLKFCIPSQWVLLGVFALIMFVTPLYSLFLLTGNAGLMAWLCAFIHMSVMVLILARWREFLREGAGLWLWLRAFSLSIAMFVYVFCRTIPAKGILWHNIYYSVGYGGRVRAMRR